MNEIPAVLSTLLKCWAAVLRSTPPPWNVFALSGNYVMTCNVCTWLHSLWRWRPFVFACECWYVNILNVDENSSKSKRYITEHVIMQARVCSRRPRGKDALLLPFSTCVLEQAPVLFASCAVCCISYLPVTSTYRHPRPPPPPPPSRPGNWRDANLLPLLLPLRNNSIASAHFRGDGVLSIPVRRQQGPGEPRALTLPYSSRPPPRPSPRTGPPSATIVLAGIPATQLHLSPESRIKYP